MFTGEEASLRAIAATGTIAVPRPLKVMVIIKASDSLIFRDVS